MTKSKPSRLTSFKLPKPLNVVKTTFGKLPKGYQTAIEQAPQDGCELDTKQKVRVETYKTSELIRLFIKRWEWDADLNELSEERDQERVRKIMGLIPKEGQWPYVSYWTNSMAGLATINIEGERGAYEENCGNYEVEVQNHGDGWHRVIAASELGLPTVDVVFLKW